MNSEWNDFQTKLTITGCYSDRPPRPPLSHSFSFISGALSEAGRRGRKQLLAKSPRENDQPIPERCKPLQATCQSTLQLNVFCLQGQNPAMVYLVHPHFPTGLEGWELACWEGSFRSSSWGTYILKPSQNIESSKSMKPTHWAFTPDHSTYLNRCCISSVELIRSFSSSRLNGSGVKEPEFAAELQKLLQSADFSKTLVAVDQTYLGFTAGVNGGKTRNSNDVKRREYFFLLVGPEKKVRKNGGKVMKRWKDCIDGRSWRGMMICWRTWLRQPNCR